MVEEGDRVIPRGGSETGNEGLVSGGFAASGKAGL